MKFFQYNETFLVIYLWKKIQDKAIAYKVYNKYKLNQFSLLNTINIFDNAVSWEFQVHQVIYYCI